VGADVYAGDIAALNGTAAASPSVFLFHIEAESQPDVLARVANVFNIANVVPLRADLRRASPDQVIITVAIELPLPATADLIRRKLEQLTCTLIVDCSGVDSAAPLPP
jgi:glycine cleavage system regulatory protein